MSELKAYQVICTDDIDRNEITENFSAPDFLAYDADEADKLIAELKEHNENYRFDSNNMLHKIMKQDAEIRHHKFKRCLDKASLCESEEKRLEAIAPLFDTDKECWEYGSDYWKKWHKRWLELAEKFKEAK